MYDTFPKNITLPDSIFNRQQKEKGRLQKMKGDAFDEAYINRMTDDHKKDVREFEKQATDGTNQDVKSFAIDNLKMLHVHQDSVVNIQKVVSKKKQTTPSEMMSPKRASHVSERPAYY